jgi:hypothetical protein
MQSERLEVGEIETADSLFAKQVSNGAAASAAQNPITAQQRRGSTGTRASSRSGSSPIDQSSLRDITAGDDYSRSTDPVHILPTVPQEDPSSELQRGDGSQQDSDQTNTIETLAGNKSSPPTNNDNKLSRLREAHARLQAQRDRLLKLEELDEQERRLKAEIEAEESKL